MIRPSTCPLSLLAAIPIGFAACDSGSPVQPPDAVFAPEKVLDIAICDAGAGGFSSTSTNPYFPFEVGSFWRYEGEDEGELLELEITALDVTEVVGGVTTRVIEEREWADGELVEVSRNYFAQAGDGTVCYFGEAVDDYEDGEIVGHEGEWRADEAGNRAGIIMPADPVPGSRYQQEDAPGIAEDEAKVVGLGPFETDFGEFEDAIRTREYNPLDEEKEYKVYAPGVGLVVDAEVELVEYTP